jgi:hypothetical protein
MKQCMLFDAIVMSNVMFGCTDKIDSKLYASYGDIFSMMNFDWTVFK